MKTQREKPIAESKIKTVKELKDLIDTKKTILLASIKNLPASQFQEISKKLRGKAIVKVPRKNLLFRALDESKNKEAKELEKHFENSIALLFSDLDSYDLAAELLKSKTAARAKPGQEAPMDIEVPAGPTDLPPGPAISELSSVGLQVMIDKGKIAIRAPKVIAKTGEKISQAAADVMAKLDIKPFSVGFVPLTALDNENKNIYVNIRIDSEETTKEMKNAFGKALAFAVGIGYANPETIKYMLGKAGIYERALTALLQTQTPESKPEAEVIEASKEPSGEEK